MEPDVASIPVLPYRGIQPYRYVDHSIFFAREEEASDLVRLVVVYRGVMLYGDSGAGKSSLINAGLIAAVRQRGFQPERVRVQPRADQEFVVERIPVADEGDALLPSLFMREDDAGPRIVLSAAAFEERLREGCATYRPLLIFDQFEELVTLFEEGGDRKLQRRIADVLVTLLRSEVIPVKVLLAFREDYLARVKQLLDSVPELVDQALRLSPPRADELETIIRGPFERYPGHFGRELTRELARRLRDKLADRFGSGEVSLSEVQTVCLRLWQSDAPEALLEMRGVQGLLEDYLGEELEAFPEDLRYAAVALLSQMVTSSGTRSVVSAEDLIAHVREDEKIPADRLAHALERLEGESKLVRRERRRDIYLYEITSEFLVPWISRRRDELVSLKASRRQRRKVFLIGSFAGSAALVAVLATLGFWALAQRSDARRAESQASALALAFSSTAQLDSRLDWSLLTSLAAYKQQARAETRSSAIAALEAARVSGATAILRGREGDAVSSVAMSPDGRLVASGGADRTVRLWDVDTHKQVGKPLRQEGKITSVAFGPRGNTLATGAGDGTVRLWDVRSGKQLGSPFGSRTGSVLSVAFSPHGDVLASGNGDGTVRLWALPTRTQTSWRRQTVRIWRVVFSPDGATLATAGGDGAVRLWNWHTHEQSGPSLRAGSEPVRGLAFSPDGATLASVGGDGALRLWDVAARKIRGRFSSHAAYLFDVAFSPDGRLLAVAGADGAVRLWNVRTRRQLAQPLRGHTDAVVSVAFSRRGSTLASGSVDGTVRLWEPNARHLGQPLSKPPPKPLPGTPGFRESGVYAVAFSVDGRTLASSGSEREVRLWDASTHKQLGLPLKGHESTVVDIAFSPTEETTLASVGDDGSARLWNLNRHKQSGTILTGLDDALWAVVFSPDGQTVAYGGTDEKVRLWDVRTHKQRALLTGHKEAVRGLAFSPDGHTLASASYDKTVRLWDARTGKELGQPLRGSAGAIFSVAFSPDGRTLASGGGEWVRLWDVRTHRQLGQPLRGHTGYVFDVAFSPDGTILASAGKDGTVRLWDVGTHKPLGKPLLGHAGAVYTVAFSPDGLTLVSGGEDRTVRLWEGIFWHDFSDLRKQVCSLVGGKLTAAEWEELVPGIRHHAACP